MRAVTSGCVYVLGLNKGSSAFYRNGEWTRVLCLTNTLGVNLL